ncbi:hypothetical protein [Pseudalkalibacillus salsuginis]|uniref:hypothetical protein n=1 Tax=Pseudalkalibacillus salsuginis TaxID=2910972 RepID=UPI001F20F866|nr:hypothetical protein [Pseudalkalibacillus salsuginis]MCF6409810.1 hypothetical protein [Pseudalkalibacillus salsuginis]
MWVITGILLVAILIIIIEVPALWKERQKKELWVFSLLLLIGVGLSIAVGLDANIPNPFDWIALLFKPLSDFMMWLLK